MLLKIVIVKYCLPVLFILVMTQPLFSQVSKLEIGMKRNAAQTLMGKTKIDEYKKDKTVYLFADSVFFTIGFDDSELCNGYSWSGKNEVVLVKSIEENEFAKRDSVTYYAKNFSGILKKETVGSEIIFRFIPVDYNPNSATVKKENTQPEPEALPAEKPSYGLTIFGMKVWEPKEKEEKP